MKQYEAIFLSSYYANLMELCVVQSISYLLHSEETSEFSIIMNLALGCNLKMGVITTGLILFIYIFPDYTVYHYCGLKKNGAIRFSHQNSFNFK